LIPKIAIVGNMTDVANRPQLVGEQFAHPTRISIVPLDPDREPWERQSAERMNYYRWFMVFMEQDTKGKERSVEVAYKKIQPDSTLIRFREVARIWSWERRAELFDEYVFRNNREAYLVEMAKMAARQARVGIVAAGMGAAVIKEFTAQLREKILNGQLDWAEAMKLLPISLRAIEVGQREERLARGFQRAVALPEPKDDDFTRVVDHLSLESGPEVESAFRQLEEILVERVTVRRVTESTSLPSYALPTPRQEEPHYPAFPEYEDERDLAPTPQKSAEHQRHESHARSVLQAADRERQRVRDSEVELTEDDLIAAGGIGDSSTNIPLFAEQRMKELRRNVLPVVEAVEEEIVLP
jgi:hypothetical protein